MATYTFNYPGGEQTHAHAGGLVTINSTQRGVMLQREVNGNRFPLEDHHGKNPLNRATVQLAAGGIVMSVGAHAFGGDRDPIVVEIN